MTLLINGRSIARAITITVAELTQLAYKDLIANEAVDKYDTVYWDGLGIKKASATSWIKMPVLGLALDTVAISGKAEVLFRGQATNPAWSWTTPGAKVYGSTTDGELTETPPSASGNVQQVIATILSATRLEIDPQGGYSIG